MPYYTMPDQEQLYVREIGQGEPVLILSGLGMSSWQWLPFILPLLHKRKFFIPDFRGFGHSTGCKIPQELDAIQSHWQDIDCLIKALKISHIDVIAYSMGATTSMHGLKYGQFSKFIKSYLQIDQTSKIKNDIEWNYGLWGNKQISLLNAMNDILIHLQQHQNRYQLISELPLAAKKKLSELFIRFAQLQQPNNRINQLLNYLPMNHLQLKALPLQSIDYLIWYLRSYLEHQEDYRSALIALDKPAEFIVGERSSLYHYQGQLQVAEQLSQSKIHLLKKSGHLPLIEEPIKFSKIIYQFLVA